MPGNSASRNVYCANSSAYPYVMSVSWSESSPNVANNTSVISASGSMNGQYVSFAAGGGYNYYLRLYWHDNRTNADTLFASTGAFNSMGMGYGSRYLSGSITVTHKDDGSLSGYVFMRFESPSTSGGWAPGTTDVVTPNTALTTIARASSFTINAGSALLGSPVSITIDRKSSSFTHRVSYQFAGSSSTTVTTSAATSASFTPPISLASQIPNATTGALTISVSTWNGGTQIGSAVNKSVNLGVPTSVVPTMGTPTAARVNNGVPSSWGVYVKTFSKCTVAIVSAAGAYGSTIKSYSITGGGLNASTSSATTGILNTAGTVTFTCKITDSRGRTATKTVSITVVDYSGPSLSVSAERCNSSGTVTADGTYLRVTVNYSFASVSGKNSITSKSVTCNGVSNTTFGDNSPFTLAANCSIGSTYVLTAKVTDALGKSFSASIDIRTATRIMNVRKDKQGLAIGKFSERDGFEVGWPSTFWEPTDFAETVKFRNGTHVHHAVGASGTAGYVKIAQIKISRTYQNVPIKITFAQRGGRRSPATLYIAFTNADSTDPTLNNSMFTFDGDDDYDIYIFKSTTSTWDLYVQKAEGYDDIGVLDYSTNHAYMSGVSITWTNEHASSIPDGALKATNLNNLTRYTASGIDPNTTMYPLILTNHANRPSSVSAYWYINTFFYSQKNSTSARAQIAMPYSTKASMYHRFYHNGAWGAWRRLVNEDELTVTTNTATGTYNGSTVTRYLYKTGNVVFCRIVWTGTAVTNTLLGFTSLTIPAGYRPPVNTFMHAAHVTQYKIYDNGVTRYCIGPDGSVNVITNASEYLERQASTSWVVAT